MFFVGSCGGDDKGNTGNTGDSGNSGDSGNTGDTGNTGNSGNTVDTGNTGNTCGIGNTGDNFPNEHDGLNWSDVLDTSEGGDWGEAVGCCKKLGGRLPTISELRTLIQNCPGTETGGECGVTDDCLSFADCWNHPCFGCEYDESGKYSIFGDADILWSSSEQSDNADRAWYVSFNDGRVYGGRHDNGSVRCVKP